MPMFKHVYFHLSNPKPQKTFKRFFLNFINWLKTNIIFLDGIKKNQSSRKNIEKVYDDLQSWNTVKPGTTITFLAVVDMWSIVRGSFMLEKVKLRL